MMPAPRRLALIVAVAASSALGCFKPDVVSGGFFCSDAGACPEGLRCNPIDRRCYKPDSGPEVRMCMDAAAIPPACGDEPAAGQACNPTCQRGCMCNDRCTVVGNASVCKVGGGKVLGASCNVNDDDCAPGLGCVRECGSTFGRCYQFCRGNSDCTAGGCDVPIGPFRACEVRPEGCNPVGAEAATSCPHSSLGCYVSSGSTICDCQGTAQPGSPCTIFNSCTPGYQCLRAQGEPMFRCWQVCRNASDCSPPNTRCDLTTGGLGFCTT